jgi:transcriptional regulator with XRE-family HTH domain
MATIENEKVSKRIRKLLNEKNMKQVDLINITSISKTAISNYLTNNRIPKAEELYKIAKALDTSMEYILTGEEYKVQQLGTDEIRLLEMYNKLNERNKGRVEQFIEERLNEQIKDNPKSSTSQSTDTEGGLKNRTVG